MQHDDRACAGGGVGGCTATQCDDCHQACRRRYAWCTCISCCTAPAHRYAGSWQGSLWAPDTPFSLPWPSLICQIAWAFHQVTPAGSCARADGAMWRSWLRA
jgi:hypothetical protein